MKKLILISLMLASAVAAFAAGYASSDECVLPTDYALNYKGSGNLQCDKEYGDDGTYADCGEPWDEYAICYFGYEAIDYVTVEHGGGYGVFYYNGGTPYTYIYGGVNDSEFTQYVAVTYGYSDHDKHTEKFSNIPVNCRYIKVRFKRDGNSNCGSSYVYSVKAYKTDSFSFYDGSTQLSDGDTIQLSTGVEKEFKIKLYGVKHLTSNQKDVTIEVVSTKGQNTTDYIKIDNTVFNDFENDSGRSGHYNLKSSEASMKVKFLKSDVYSIYVNVKYDGLIVQRRYITFEVSD